MHTHHTSAVCPLLPISAQLLTKLTISSTEMNTHSVWLLLVVSTDQHHTHTRVTQYTLQLKCNDNWKSNKPVRVTELHVTPRNINIYQDIAGKWQEAFIAVGTPKSSTTIKGMLWPINHSAKEFLLHLHIWESSHSLENLTRKVLSHATESKNCRKAANTGNRTHSVKLYGLWASQIFRGMVTGYNSLGYICHLTHHERTC